MRKYWITLALLAGLGLAVGACEVVDEGDGEVEGTEGEGEGAVEGEGEGAEPTAYRWIRLCSNATVPADKVTTPGPDIDAVRACDSSNDCQWATMVGNSMIEGGQNKWSDPKQALGWSNTTSVTEGTANCGTLDPTEGNCVCADPLKCQAWVSIGGVGKYLILGFDKDIEPGDKVTVFEVGKKTSPGAADEEVKASMGFEDTQSGRWIAGASGSDEFSFFAPDVDGPEQSCP